MFNYNMFYIYDIDFYCYEIKMQLRDIFVLIEIGFCDKKIFNCFIFKILMFIILDSWVVFYIFLLNELKRINKIEEMQFIIYQKYYILINI